MKSINKAITILESFIDKSDGLSLSEIARSTKINISTACVIAAALTKRGYLRQDGKRGRYHLGTRLLAFSDGVKMSNRLRNIALPYLENLSRKVNESIILCILEGDNVVILERIQSSQELTVTTRSKTTIHSTAVGKAILSGMPQEELDRFLSNIQLTRDTPNTITDIAKLKKQILKAKQDVYATDDQEKNIGVRGIAVPIFYKSGKIAGSVGVIGPSIRLDNKKMAEIIGLIKNCGYEISTALGYRDQEGVPHLEAKI